jgi:hypothetical protein
VIAYPPVSVGSVHDTVACALPPTAVTLVGAPSGVHEAIAARRHPDEDLT